MKAIVRISAIKIEAEVDSDNYEVGRKAQEILDNAQESIEAAMAQAACEQIKRLLPGISAVCTGAWNEGEETNE